MPTKIHKEATGYYYIEIFTTTATATATTTMILLLLLVVVVVVVDGVLVKNYGVPSSRKININE